MDVELAVLPELRLVPGQAGRHGGALESALAAAWSRASASDGYLPTGDDGALGSRRRLGPARSSAALVQILARYTAAGSVQPGPCRTNGG